MPKTKKTPQVEIQPKEPLDKQEKVQPEHPVVIAAKFLKEHMNDFNRSYWTKEAKKKGYTLEQMVALYIVADFGISKQCIELFLVKKKDLNE